MSQLIFLRLHPNPFAYLPRGIEKNLSRRDFALTIHDIHDIHDIHGIHGIHDQWQTLS